MNCGSRMWETRPKEVMLRMRDITFRGKTIDSEAWICGDLRQYKPGRAGICNRDTCRTIKVDPDTIGQFTGLTDDDGIRIFEGDIVSGLFRFGMKKNALVTFKDGAFGLEWYRGGIAHFDAFTSVCNVKYQVLGNIYDNPELLFKED